MKKINSKSRQLGQGMTEYIIIVALIAVAAIGVYSAFGDVIRGQMGAMTQELSGNEGTTGKAAAAAGAKKGTDAEGAKTLKDFGTPAGK